MKCVDVPSSQLSGFLDKFDPTYLDRLDAGESDSLAFFLNQLDNGENWYISSSDAIVYTVLGRLHLSERGISLEEILYQIGRGRGLKKQYSKEFRIKATKKGEQDGIMDIGLQETD